MHISDGVLPLSVSLAGFAVTAAATAWCLRKTEPEEIPKVAVVTASFFAASLIHLPLGPTSVHLLLPGLVGALLGPAAAFLSITVGLVLQSMLFQFGGLTALGANAMIMGIPAVLCGMLFKYCKGKGLKSCTLAGGIAGGLGTLLAGIGLAAMLSTAGENFFGVAKIALVSHLPVMVIEALVSACAISFIFRVKPDMLQSSQPILNVHEPAT